MFFFKKIIQVKNTFLKIIIIFFIANYSFAQIKANVDSTDLNHKLKIKKITGIDFTNYKYKNLDENFKIITTEKQYNIYVKKYKIYPQSIKNYSDSLQVVLTGEFDDFDYSRIATLKLTYSWERVALYCREDVDKIKSIAKKIEIKYPVKFKEELENDSLKIPEIKLMIFNLKEKLTTQYGQEQIDKLKNNNQLLNFSFKRNPDVSILRENVMIKKNIEKFSKKHNRYPTDVEKKKLGLECGKENCCQKK